ncbi:divergent polysaccharide deacetylase family protein [uncultured Maricaulis sp.]|uniref:divergent polysaccharide deacetylase family protein n=1 Tax=uncultured Maricaulis sp. TaxID=174710 RepID=UPI0030DA8F37|tara:strand:- start:8504 stop:9817 length:1314 start_codon:yes stop_codon:yes gene_type:complete
MSSAVLRHVEPLLSIKAPLFAGLGATALFAVVILGVAVFGKADLQPPQARGGVSPAPIETVHTAAELRIAPTDQPPGIQFVEPAGSDEVRLAGVEDRFEAPPVHNAGSDPAEAEARHAARSTNANALAPAPLPGLSENGPDGPLPIIAANGLRPSRAYARPFHGDPGAPTVAVVIGGMGLNRAVTQSAIDDLPPAIALSFAPYTRDLQTWVDLARAAGHEVLIEAPMEPFDYPNNDPGPQTLLADGSPADNLARLEWVLSRTTGYFAVSNYLGARFSTSETAMTQLLQSLEDRGLAFLHDGAGRRTVIETAAQATDVQYAIADRVLDEDPSPTAIDDHLLTLEALALQNGAALGAGFSYPTTVNHVRDWANSLDSRGYQLAPPSAVMARRRLQARLAAEARALEPEPEQVIDNRWSRPPAEASSGGDHAPAPPASGH